MWSAFRRTQSSHPLSTLPGSTYLFSIKWNINIFKELGFYEMLLAIAFYKLILPPQASFNVFILRQASLSRLAVQPKQVLSSLFPCLTLNSLDHRPTAPDLTVVSSSCHCIDFCKCILGT